MGMKIVEVEQSPCQHLHSANYDAAKVIKGQSIEPLPNGQQKCFDCGELFTLQLPPRRYTLSQIEELAKEWRDANHVPNDIQLAVSHLLVWLAQREKEGRDESLRSAT